MAIRDLKVNEILELLKKGDVSEEDVYADFCEAENFGENIDINKYNDVMELWEEYQNKPQEPEPLEPEPLEPEPQEPPELDPFGPIKSRKIVDDFLRKLKKIETTDNTLKAKASGIIDLVKTSLEGNLTKEDFLGIIRDDNNLFSSGIIREMLESNIITIRDLRSINIDEEFIEKVQDNISSPQFERIEPFDHIGMQSTEVYFWGIPSSGKSCALGAILSTASNGKIARSIEANTASQGYSYMTRLRNIFKEGEVGSLMQGTAIDAFYEMGFTLTDNERKKHPITCVDMAGELMCSMYRFNANESMTEIDEQMMEVLHNVLVDESTRSRNRKIHFFVVEYGAENRSYRGLSQRYYLEGAAAYIKNTGIFKKETDAIYIIITKADKAPKADQEYLKSYIQDKYGSFFNWLDDICRDNEINGGKVDTLAFTLGKVCFQDFCRFNPKAAENVVNILLRRSASTRTGRFGRVMNRLNG